MLNVGVDRYQEEVWRLQARGVNLNEAQQSISCCFAGNASSRRGRTTILPAGVALAISVSNAVNR